MCKVCSVGRRNRQFRYILSIGDACRIEKFTHRTDNRFPFMINISGQIDQIDKILDLYDADNVLGWEPYSLYDLEKVSWAEYLRYTSCTTYHDGNLGSRRSRLSIQPRWSICPMCGKFQYTEPSDFPMYRVLPSIPWHPHMFYARTERKVSRYRHRGRIICFLVFVSIQYRKKSENTVSNKFLVHENRTVLNTFFVCRYHIQALCLGSSRCLVIFYPSTSTAVDVSTIEMIFIGMFCASISYRISTTEIVLF